ncbi:MAG: hypothetical protein ACLRXP_04500 [Oscillospiraceae bacterium]
MFSNLILRNSHRSRKENGLFFSSLVISIVAFYMILSISTQDVMIFLQKMESDAVEQALASDSCVLRNDPRYSFLFDLLRLQVSI